MESGADVIEYLKGVPVPVTGEIDRQNVVSRHRLFIGSNFSETLFLYKDLLIQVSVITLYSALGLWYYSTKENWDFSEVMYFIISTSLGVGAGSYHPTTGTQPLSSQYLYLFIH